LSGPEGSLRLEPKVMNVLVCLAELSGEVVTHDQFAARVWRGRLVSDEVVSRCISLLRTGLGDDPREPRFIQTLPKIGYRLLIPVEPLLPAAQETSEAESVAAPVAEAPVVPQRRTRRWPVVLGVILGLLLAAASYIYVDRRSHQAARPASQPTIAVLPFVNRSGNRDNEYFSDGLTDEIIDRLANIPGMRVVASTTSFALKNRNEDVRSIAKRLRVRYILEGSVRKEGDRVRITAQLVDAERGFHIWSKPFDTQLSGIFAVQDTIANGIVEELLPTIEARSGEAKEAAAQTAKAPPTAVMSAYELLLRGRYHLKRREEAPIRRSIDLFKQAIALDPSFAEAYRELGRAYAILPYYSYEDLDEMSDLAVQTIRTGTTHAPQLARTAQDVLAFVHTSRWEWVEAEQDFRQALMFSPKDSNVHQWYSQLLARVGKPEESLREALDAHSYDVLSPVVNDRLAVAYMWVNDDTRARRQFEIADELGLGPRAQPEAYIVLLLRQGEYDKARDILVDLQKFFARATEWIDPFIAAQRDPAGRPAARKALIKAARERGISLRYLFGAWVFLGDADSAMDVAFELLQDPTQFDVEFLFARETVILRRHPRFGELIKALGLDRYWDQFGWPATCARKGPAIECH